MKGSITRTAAWALSIVLTLSAAVVPCAASDQAGTKRARPHLTQLSAASQQLLGRSPAVRAQRQPDSPSEGSPGSFFRSKRGAVTLALMGAGVGFTLWSIQHDRKPVKSPVR